MTTVQALPFFPNSIAGCQLWLDAADPATFTLSGTNISAWRDKSGSNNNASVETGTPTYSGNGVVFTGSQMFNTPLSTVNNTQTFFCVLANNSNAGHIVSVKSASINNGYNYMISSSAQNISRFGGTAITTGATLTAGARCLFGASIAGGGNSFLYLNGSQTGFASGTASVSGSGATLAIGAYYYTTADPAPVGYFTGTINEMILYYATLTLAQRQQIEGYLAWKWGLQGSLPTTHPYYTIAPNSQALTLPPAVRSVAPTQSFQMSSSPFFFFRPSSITGCVLWLDGTDPNGTGVLPANNASVSTWSDKSGNANNATGGSGQFQINRLNMLPGIYFPTTSYGLAKPATLPGGTTTGATFFAVFAGSGNDAGIFAQVGGGGVACDRTGRIYYINTSQNAIYSTLYCGVAQTSTTYTANTPFLLSDVYINSSSGVYTHNSYSSGTLFGSAGVSGVNTGTSTARIGENLIGSFFTGYMYEMIMYTGSLTDAQRQQVEGYLAWKWGLNAQLPSSHPFRNSVPGLSISIPVTRSLRRGIVNLNAYSGLVMWYDAADPAGTGYIPSNGENITAWVDKSGRGITLTGNTLTFSTSPSPYSIAFNNNSIGNGSAGVNVNTLTVFVVWFQTNAGSNRPLFYLMSSANAFQQTGVSIYSDSTSTRPGGISQIRVYTNNNLPGLASASMPAATSTEVVPINITSITIDSTNAVAIYINGSLSGTLSPNLTRNTTANNIALGTETSVPGGSSIANISELIFYNSLLTTGQRQTVEGYLAWKWNLVANLPPNHPFKKFQPPPN